MKLSFASLSKALPTVAALSVAAWQALTITRAIRLGKRLARQALPFQANPQQASARVLLIGDSTGVGVGSASESDSLPGLLAAEFPHVQIVNACCNGARVADTLQQWRMQQRSGMRFDLVLVMAGGNDVLKLTPMQHLQSQVRSLLQEMVPQVGHVIWLGCADVGMAPALKPPLNWFFGWRCRLAMRTLHAQVRQARAEFIDFCARRHRLIFTQHPERFFAPDGLHPSSHSYQHCFNELKCKVPLAHFLSTQARDAASLGVGGRASGDAPNRWSGPYSNPVVGGAHPPAAMFKPLATAHGQMRPECPLAQAGGGDEQALWPSGMQTSGAKG